MYSQQIAPIAILLMFSWRIQSKVLCSPTVLNGNIKMYPICSNSVCKKKLNVPAGSTIASCRSCGRKLLVKRGKIDKTALLQLAENDDKECDTVTIFPQQLKDVFGEACISSTMQDLISLKNYCLQNLTTFICTLIRRL